MNLLQNTAIKSSIKYRPDIDGLRAIAIIFVLIYHFFSNLLPSGFIGVDIFFVISGFLITKIILKEIDDKSFSFANFYLRRILRILPALFLMLLVSFIFATLILSTKDMIWFARSLHYSSLQISNFFFQRATDYFNLDNNFEPLLHTWSLAVEEQFYILMPLILFILWRFKKDKNLAFWVILILSLTSLFLSQLLISYDRKIAFFSLPSRFWELGIGCLLAFDKINLSSFRHRKILSLIGLASVFASAFFVDDSYFPGFVALFPCLGASLLILNQGEKNFVSKILSNNILVFIGKISYSLYLWHLPMIMIYKKYQGVASLGVIESLILILILIVVATISWKFVEIPFRKKYSFLANKYPVGLKNKIRHPFFIALVVVLIFAILGRVAQKTQGLKFRLAHSDLLNEVNLDKYAEFEKPCGIGKRSAPFPDINNCVVGKNQQNYQAVVFGDSHAGHYSPAVTKWALKNNLSLMSFYVFSCPPIISNQQNTFQQCQDYRQNISQVLKEKNHIKYVFLAGSWPGIEDFNLFKSQLEDTVKFIISLDKEVVIMNSIPNTKIAGLDMSPLECIERDLAPIQKILPMPKVECFKLPITKFSKQQQYIDFTKQISKKYSKVTFFDPFDYLCDQKNCYFVKNNKVLYADWGHLNKNGAEFIADFMKFSLLEK